MTQVRATSPRRERSKRRPAATIAPCAVCQTPTVARYPETLCYVCRFAALKAQLGQ